MRQGAAIDMVQVPPGAHLILDSCQTVMTVIALDYPLLVVTDGLPCLGRGFIPSLAVGMAVHRTCLGRIVGKDTGPPGWHIRGIGAPVHIGCAIDMKGNGNQPGVGGIHRRIMTFLTTEIETVKTGTGVVDVGFVTIAGNG